MVSPIFVQGSLLRKIHRYIDAAWVNTTAKCRRAYNSFYLPALYTFQTNPRNAKKEGVLD
jgi:hypothetical protein